MGEWSITTGWRDGRDRSHAWLERDGWIVDITANQFVSEVEEPVLMLRESSWHRTWNDHQTSSVGVGVSYYSEESGAREDYVRLCALADGLSRSA